MIKIQHLEKTYQANGRSVQALQDINLSIDSGKIFGIIGRSGAGKSTLLRTLNLLERPTSGRILIDDQDITGYDGAALQGLRQRTGMVFQHFNLLYAKTIRDNIDFPLRLAGSYSAQQRRERVDQLLELVGLTEQGQQYPAQLSGGQKQRVGIARALANYPTLLLCDEATSALDPETTQSILALLAEINRKLGLTIVLITHEMQVIRSICDQVAVIDGGHIVEQGEVAQVFLHPQHPTTQKLIAEHQAIDPDWLQGAERHPHSQLLRLSYIGAATHQPVLSRIAIQTGAEMAILQGTIGRIKDTPYGQMVVELSAAPEVAREVLQQLQQMQVSVEVIEGSI